MSKICLSGSKKTQKAAELTRCIGNVNFDNVKVDSADGGIVAYKAECDKLSNGITSYQQQFNKIKTGDDPNYKEKKSKARPLLNAVIQCAKAQVNNKWGIIEHGKELAKALEDCATSPISKRSVLSDPGIKAIFTQLHTTLQAVVKAYEVQAKKVSELQAQGKKDCIKYKEIFIENKKIYTEKVNDCKAIYDAIRKLLGSAEALCNAIDSWFEQKGNKILYRKFEISKQEIPSNMRRISSCREWGKDTRDEKFDLDIKLRRSVRFVGPHIGDYSKFADEIVEMFDIPDSEFDKALNEYNKYCRTDAVHLSNPENFLSRLVVYNDAPLLWQLSIPHIGSDVLTDKHLFSINYDYWKNMFDRFNWLYNKTNEVYQSILKNQ